MLSLVMANTTFIDPKESSSVAVTTINFRNALERREKLPPFPAGALPETAPISLPLCWMRRKANSACYWYGKWKMQNARNCPPSLCVSSLVSGRGEESRRSTERNGGRLLLLLAFVARKASKMKREEAREAIRLSTNCWLNTYFSQSSQVDPPGWHFAYSNGPHLQHHSGECADDKAQEIGDAKDGLLCLVFGVEKHSDILQYC